jgi:hypothetical protein
MAEGVKAVSRDTLLTDEKSDDAIGTHLLAASGIIGPKYKVEIIITAERIALSSLFPDFFIIHPNYINNCFFYYFNILLPRLSIE